MPSEKLHQALEELRREIQASGLAPGPSRDRLEALIACIEAGAEESGETSDAQTGEDTEHAGLIDTVRDSIGQLEVEHPTLTQALIQIMTSLGGAGI